MQLVEIGFRGRKRAKHTLESQFRRIIRATEMREQEPAPAIGTSRLQNGIRRLGIGEVAGGTEDAHF